MVSRCCCKVHRDILYLLLVQVCVSGGLSTMDLVEAGQPLEVCPYLVCVRAWIGCLVHGTTAPFDAFNVGIH